MKFQDIRILRAIAILSIVLGHSLAIHTSAWSFIYKIEPFIPFKILGYLVSSYFLWLFVIISGFLFAHQSRNHKETLRKSSRKKFRRLLVPYFFWGVLYFFIFNNSSDYSLSEMVYQLSNGIGHLWFLLMLFWVFLFSGILQKLRTSKRNYRILIVLLFFIGIGMLSINLNFLQIANSFKYLIGFYFGGVLYNNQVIISEFKNSKIFKYSLFFLFLFALKYLGEFLIRYHLNISEPTTIQLYKELTGLPLGLLASFVIYAYVRNNADKIKAVPQKVLFRIEKASFGIYIFHQFFMFLLLNYINDFISPISWPFVLFLFGLSISLFLSILFTRTKYISWLL